MLEPISEFEHEYRTAKIYPRGNTFRVTCIDIYFDNVEEFFCNTLEESENKAEDWVLNK
jgi:hypothetical protein